MSKFTGIPSFKILVFSVLALMLVSGCTKYPQAPVNIPGLADGEKMVTKIIDGDTVIVEGGFSIRLLGIDTDEKGYPCFASAKQRLEELVLNKVVFLERDTEDQDQYKRYLRYLILGGENINLKMVKEGLAVARFSPDNKKYRKEITDAEKEAMTNKIGCKWGQKPEETPQETVPSGEPAPGAIGACNAGNYIG